MPGLGGAGGGGSAASRPLPPASAAAPSPHRERDRRGTVGSPRDSCRALPHWAMPCASTGVWGIGGPPGPPPAPHLRGSYSAPGRGVQWGFVRGVLGHSSRPSPASPSLSPQLYSRLLPHGEKRRRACVGYPRTPLGSDAGGRGTGVGRCCCPHPRGKKYAGGRRKKVGRDPGGHQGGEAEGSGGAGPCPGAAGLVARRGSSAGSRRAADAALAIALSFPQ